MGGISGPVDYPAISDFQYLVNLSKKYDNVAVCIGYELVLNKGWNRHPDVWLNNPHCAKGSKWNQRYDGSHEWLCKLQYQRRLDASSSIMVIMDLLFRWLITITWQFTSRTRMILKRSTRYWKTRSRRCTTIIHMFGDRSLKMAWGCTLAVR